MFIKNTDPFLCERRNELAYTVRRLIRVSLQETPLLSLQNNLNLVHPRCVKSTGVNRFTQHVSFSKELPVLAYIKAIIRSYLSRERRKVYRLLKDETSHLCLQ
jgi:hypothetical protein